MGPYEKFNIIVNFASYVLNIIFSSEHVHHFKFYLLLDFIQFSYTADMSGANEGGSSVPEGESQREGSIPE